MRNIDLRLILSTWSQSSSVTSENGLRGPIPALLTRMETSPRDSRTSLIKRET